MLTDFGPYYLTTFIYQSSVTSNPLWLTMNEIYPEGGEEIANCTFGSVFTDKLNKGETGSSLYKGLKIYRANDYIPIKLITSTA